MFSIPEQKMCQMSMTKPCSNLRILKELYINVSNVCKLSIQYNFNFLNLLMD